MTDKPVIATEEHEWQMVSGDDDDSSSISRFPWQKESKKTAAIRRRKYTTLKKEDDLPVLGYCSTEIKDYICCVRIK